MFSPNSSIILLITLFVDTASNGVSEAFVNSRYSIAKTTPCSSLTSTGLAFHPRRVDDCDFHTPAESFTFTRYAQTTISSEYVKSEWNEIDEPKRLSYLDVISSTASVSNGFDQNQEDIYSNTPEEPLVHAHRIQQAYREWCEFYGKIANKQRLGIFASNFLAVEEFHERTGRPLVLNEFADLTEEEYRKDKQSSENDTTEKVEAEDRIREAYRQWCDYYGRSYEDKRLQTFAANYIVVEKYHLRTKESLVLNEYADMTEQEYRKHLANIQPKANDDTNALLQEQKEGIESSNDPITLYLDPDPRPIADSHVNELNTPIPKSRTQIAESNDKNSNSGVSLESTNSLDDSSSSNEALAALQSRVESLNTMVQSLATAPPVAPQPVAQPLDSLVIDLLQQQDASIAQLEDSVEGLHNIQKQSSDLIELVSNNQKQMTEMMEDVQSEVAMLQNDQKQVEENYSLLLSRIEELEAVVAKFNSNDPVLNTSLVLSPATGTKRRRVELKPNIPPIGYIQPFLVP